MFPTAGWQEKWVFPDYPVLSAVSWRLAVRNYIPVDIWIIPDGIWPSGISCTLVVNISPGTKLYIFITPLIILEHDLSYLLPFFPVQITPKTADIPGSARPQVCKIPTNIPRVGTVARKTPSYKAKRSLSQTNKQFISSQNLMNARVKRIRTRSQQVWNANLISIHCLQVFYSNLTNAAAINLYFSPEQDKIILLLEKLPVNWHVFVWSIDVKLWWDEDLLEFNSITFHFYMDNDISLATLLWWPVQANSYDM